MIQMRPNEAKALEIIGLKIIGFKSCRGQAGVTLRSRWGHIGVKINRRIQIDLCHA